VHGNVTAGNTINCTAINGNAYAGNKINYWQKSHYIV
jgi:hypothetical protein